MGSTGAKAEMKENLKRSGTCCSELSMGVKGKLSGFDEEKTRENNTKNKRDQATARHEASRNGVTWKQGFGSICRVVQPFSKSLWPIRTESLFSGPTAQALT